MRIRNASRALPTTEKSTPAIFRMLSQGYDKTQEEKEVPNFKISQGRESFGHTISQQKKIEIELEEINRISDNFELTETDFLFLSIERGKVKPYQMSQIMSNPRNYELVKRRFFNDAKTATKPGQGKCKIYQFRIQEYLFPAQLQIFKIDFVQES